MENHITVWRFCDAPKELQDLSMAGGDEDWLAVVPPSLALEQVEWMETGTRFGVYSVYEYPMPGRPGWVVRIGAHA